MPPPLDDVPPPPDFAPPLLDVVPPMPDDVPPLPDFAPPLLDDVPPLPDFAPPLLDDVPPALDDAPPLLEVAPPPEDGLPLHAAVAPNTRIIGKVNGPVFMIGSIAHAWPRLATRSHNRAGEQGCGGSLHAIERPFNGVATLLIVCASYRPKTIAPTCLHTGKTMTRSRVHELISNSAHEHERTRACKSRFTQRILFWFCRDGALRTSDVTHVCAPSRQKKNTNHFALTLRVGG